MKILLLLLLLASTDAKSLGHNVSSTLKTNSGAVKNISPLQEMSRYKASTVNCAELKDGDSSSEVISTCANIIGYPEYTLRVLDAKGLSWDSFNSRLTLMSKVGIEIEGSDIDKLKLDALDAIVGYKDIIIENNLFLKEISFTLTETMYIGKLTITGNQELQTIKIKPAKAFECTEIVISKNPKLETLEFVGAATYTISQMAIRQNVLLKDFSDIGKLKPDASVIFEGNRLMKPEDLTQLKSINSSWKIQPPGHCVFDKPIDKLSQLNACIVVNQLKFAKGATGTIGDPKLTSVEDGDVYLADIPIGKLGVLKQVSNIKKITSDICDFPPIKGIKVISPPCPSTTEESITAASPGFGPSSGSGPSPGGGPSPRSGPSPGPSSNLSNSASNSSSSNDLLSFISDEHLIIVGSVILLVIIIAIATVFILYCITRKRGQSFCSWLCCRKKADDAVSEKTITQEDLAIFELGSDGGLPVYGELPNDDKLGRMAIPDYDYIIADKGYVVRWKGDFKEGPYDEKLRTLADLPDVAEMSPIQKEVNVSMMRFNGGKTGDMKELYFYQKNKKKIGNQRQKMNEMVDKQIDDKFQEYYKYLKKNNMLQSLPEPSKYTKHEMGKSAEPNTNNTAQSGSNESTEEIPRKEGGKNAKAPEHGGKRLDKKELDLLDDIIMVMLLPNYHRIVDYDDEKKHVILRILELVLDYMKTTPTLVEVPVPCVVLGDIHGQYRDLMRIFRMFNENNKHGIFNQRYLFLGDYVDRGHYSLEVVLLLFLLKMRHPTRFFLLRGNHEIRDQNLNPTYYAFVPEIQEKLENTGFWEKFAEIYDYLPLAALVGRRVLCMHGGISKHLNSLEDIKNIEKPLACEILATFQKTHPLAHELMWNDPAPREQKELYSPNTNRHTGYFWNTQAVLDTCKSLGVDLIVRAHQCPQRGFNFMEGIRELLTIFSAPNYNKNSPDRNDGALLILKVDGKMEIRKYGSEKNEEVEKTEPKQK